MTNLTQWSVRVATDDTLADTLKAATAAGFTVFAVVPFGTSGKEYLVISSQG
jgi:hypothetical protein